MLKEIMWKSPVPHCTQISKEICKSMSRNSFMPFSKVLGRSMNRFIQRSSLLYTLLWRTVMPIFMKIW